MVNSDIFYDKKNNASVEPRYRAPANRLHVHVSSVNKLNITSITCNIAILQVIYTKTMLLSILQLYLEGIQSVFGISPGVKYSHIRAFMAFAIIIMRGLVKRKKK